MFSGNTTKSPYILLGENVVFLFTNYIFLLFFVTNYFSLSYTTQSLIAVPLNEKYLRQRKVAKESV